MKRSTGPNKTTAAQIVNRKLSEKQRRLHGIKSSSRHGLVFEVRSKLGLSQEKFAHMVGVTQRTIWRWEQRLGQPDHQSFEFLTGLNEIIDTLLSNLEPYQVARWLWTPQPDLLGYCPLESARSAFGAATVHDIARRISQQPSS